MLRIPNFTEVYVAEIKNIISVKYNREEAPLPSPIFYSCK